MVHENLRFINIMRLFRHRVYQVAFGILGDARETEESVQDIFLKIHRGLKDFRNEADLSTWIYRITVNTSLSRRRAKPLDKFSYDDAEVEREVARSGVDPEELYIDQESKDRVVALTAALGEKECQAITLFYLEEMPYEEIADVMKMSVGSVASHISRGRVHLHILMVKGDSK